MRSLYLVRCSLKSLGAPALEVAADRVDSGDTFILAYAAHYWSCRYYRHRGALGRSRSLERDDLEVRCSLSRLLHRRGRYSPPGFLDGDMLPPGRAPEEVPAPEFTGARAPVATLLRNFSLASRAFMGRGDLPPWVLEALLQGTVKLHPGALV